MSNWRRKVATVLAGAALAVPLSFVATSPAQANFCHHYSHYTWTGSHYDYDYFHGEDYFSGGWWHHWHRSHPGGGVTYFYDGTCGH